MLFPYREIFCFPGVEAGGEGGGVEKTEIEEEDAAGEAFAIVRAVDEDACG